MNSHYLNNTLVADDCKSGKRKRDIAPNKVI